MVLKMEMVLDVIPYANSISVFFYHYDDDR